MENEDSERLLYDALQQCEFPPRLIRGKSSMADLFIDDYGYLCIVGHKKYIQTIKRNEIKDVLFVNQNIFILAQYELSESRPIVLSFFCSDSGIYSLKFKLYGKFR